MNLKNQNLFIINKKRKYKINLFKINFYRQIKNTLWVTLELHIQSKDNRKRVRISYND